MLFQRSHTVICGVEYRFGIEYHFGIKYHDTKPGIGKKTRVNMSVFSLFVAGE
jgi:hypothetical protein